MHVALSLQYTVIAVAVLLSTWVVLNHKLPGTTRRLRLALVRGQGTMAGAPGTAPGSPGAG